MLWLLARLINLGFGHANNLFQNVLKPLEWFAFVCIVIVTFGVLHGASLYALEVSSS
jgi:hypothetical protein